jgi:hypothetical protein
VFPHGTVNFRTRLPQIFSGILPSSNYQSAGLVDAGVHQEDDGGNRRVRLIPAKNRPPVGKESRLRERVQGIVAGPDGNPWFLERDAAKVARVETGVGR